MVLTDTRYFVPMLIITDIYKGARLGHDHLLCGAVSGVDPSAL